jgi:hypothetical protein
VRGEALGQREVRVAPAAGRERLQLQVGVGGERGADVRAHVAGVIEDRALPVERADALGEAPLEALFDLPREARHVRLARRVQAGGQHAFQAIRAVARALPDDVEEEAVHVERREHFFRLSPDELDVGRVEAELVPARLQRRGAVRLAVRRALEPLRVAARLQLVPAHRDVDRDPDAGGVAGGDLLRQQVAGDTPRGLKSRGF